MDNRYPLAPKRFETAYDNPTAPSSAIGLTASLLDPPADAGKLPSW
jgi:hypothetical protein